MSDMDFTSFRRLMERASWTPEQIRAFQQDKLKKALRHAAAASAYYRETIGALVERDAPLEAMPVLTKSDLVANFDRIVTDPRLSQAVLRDHLFGPQAGELLFDEFHVAATGGTSGEVLAFAYDEPAWQALTLNVFRLRMTFDSPDWMSLRSVSIAGTSPIHFSTQLVKAARDRSPTMPEVSVTTPIEVAVAKLNDYQPESISTYPSFLRMLAHEQRMGRLRIAPVVVRSGAEALTQDIRDLVNEVWGVPVVDTYVCTEVGMMARDCVHFTGKHLAEDLAFYEVVDADNQRVEPGVQGAKVLVTTFANSLIPLVRYELTDAITLANGRCACGSPFARIAAIGGRLEDHLRFTRKGGGQTETSSLWLRAPVMAIPGVRQFQLVQESGTLVATISVFPDYDAETACQRVRDKLLHTLDGLDIVCEVSVHLVGDIPRVGMAQKEVSVRRQSLVSGQDP